MSNAAAYKKYILLTWLFCCHFVLLVCKNIS